MFKSWKFKILFPLFLVTTVFLVFVVLWHFPISEGKRVGNMTKISHKGKFSFTKTWEGTIDEGVGDKLTSFFSVRDEKIADSLYAFEGKEVTIFYKEYFIGWPWETKYDVYDWKPLKSMNDVQNSNESMTMSASQYQAKNLDKSTANVAGPSDSSLSSQLSMPLFCSLMGSLYFEPELYEKVKEHLKQKNLYLFKQLKKCNE